MHLLRYQTSITLSNQMYNCLLGMVFQFCKMKSSREGGGGDSCMTLWMFRIHWIVCVLSHSVESNSFWPHGLYSARLLCPWNFPVKRTGVSHQFLLQGIFLTQGMHLLHWQSDSLPLSYLVCFLTTIEKKKRKQNKTICTELINIYFRVLKGNR